MKKKLTSLTILMTICFLTLTTIEAAAEVVGGKKVTIGVSQSDAEIWVNGKMVAKGSTEIKVEKNSCANISIRKVGFLEEQLEICNNKTSIWEKSKYFEMKRDDSYDASIQTDIANVDIELIVNTMDKDTAWKLINQIVLNYIDVIEMTDKETGYLRTAWSLKAFKQNTVRTRIIVKESSTDPLVFKAKLISEFSGSALTSVKADELYKEWDRVLRSYSDVISEFQARVK
ncbi:hypothetical protein KXJ69_00285 [Aureisphaera sp. CAU 1614]|uniref:PEGA domain-containing protein n=1 Tax=Halomarinibacterium sedimenti TaxID=2857106 RepID=A0A9X1FL07_9FLAO|nr:hypothetical protein [Halomarinibacterium sedimenti]MBW2936520.1 hypothetical protein [Halomarinibacterium sedimenti]